VWTELNSDRLDQGLARWVIPWLGRRAAIVRVNVHARGKDLVSAGVPERKIKYVAPGIDMERSRTPQPTRSIREELGLAEDSCLVATIGRLTWEKGQADLIGAVARLGPVPKDVHVLLIGEGPGRAGLEALVYSHGLDKQVHFLGYRKDVPALLQQVTVVVVPSYHENLSYVVLEAMAAGVPLIATRVGGIPEVVSDGHTGVLVPPQNVVGLAEALERVLRNPTWAAELATVGRDRIVSGFSLAHEMAAVQELLIEHSAVALTRIGGVEE
jgi:glycosyltransferase involved in cell wall biosynthesis